ncbi:hypothetical protein BVRB_1g011890 [Beta vulgaris subsp. vulgaris]|nr:hypothetical protein BVRB_1g011890 [Beta vulgaris subsp. vulgaris]
MSQREDFIWRNYFRTVENQDLDNEDLQSSSAIVGLFTDMFPDVDAVNASISPA